MKSIIHSLKTTFFFIKIIKKLLVYILKKKQILESLNEYNVLVSSPSSGSTFVRLVLSSYHELNTGYGNGIPKYNSYLNKDIFALTPLIMGDYKNEFSLDKLGKENLSELKENSTKLVFFSRLPLGNANNIFDINKSKIIVLLRDPYDEILSSTVKKVKDINDKNHLIYILNEKINNYKKYVSFWNDHLKKGYKIKIIKFDEIKYEPEKSLKKILEFFNHPIKLNLLNTSINMHSIESTHERMKNIKKPNYFRFSNKEIRSKLKEKYSKHIFNNDSYIKSLKIYEKLKNL